METFAGAGGRLASPGLDTFAQLTLCQGSWVGGGLKRRFQREKNQQKPSSWGDGPKGMHICPSDLLLPGEACFGSTPHSPNRTTLPGPNGGTAIGFCQGWPRNFGATIGSSLRKLLPCRQAPSACLEQKGAVISSLPPLWLSAFHHHRTNFLGASCPHPQASTILYLANLQGKHFNCFKLLLERLEWSTIHQPGFPPQTTCWDGATIHHTRSIIDELGERC